jgi:hypothetical protein
MKREHYPKDGKRETKKPEHHSKNNEKRMPLRCGGKK